MATFNVCLCVFKKPLCSFAKFFSVLKPEEISDCGTLIYGKVIGCTHILFNKQRENTERLKYSKKTPDSF